MVDRGGRRAKLGAGYSKGNDDRLRTVNRTAPDDGFPADEDHVSQSTDAPLSTTPLDALHRELGARMVPFAGYAMPVQYPAGILAEHKQCRAEAALFDVSHMGQARLWGADAAAAFETLVPGDIKGLAAGAQRYTLLTNDQGGIRDDLMVSNAGDHLFLVVNAACKQADFAYIAERLSGRARLDVLTDRALLALQGPKAAAVLARLAPEVAALRFMQLGAAKIDGVDCVLTRSGYTGEDGYEISLPVEAAERIARRLLAEPEVKPAGLGARDSLRLEAGLCLYGSDIDTTTTPIEANLAWTIGKRRRVEGGYPGAEAIARQLAEGVARKRVGIQPDGPAPARAHTKIMDAHGAAIGEITSGGFSPTLNRPIAMGYVATAQAGMGGPLTLDVRGKALPAKVAPLPFVTQRYAK